MFTAKPPTTTSLPHLTYSKTLKAPHPHFLPSLQNPKPSLPPLKSLSNPLTIAPPTPPSSSSSSSSVPTQSTAQIRVDILAESLPFIQKFRGKTIVVKYGGAAMKSADLQSSVVNDLVLLSCVGLRPLLVHGGGPEINAMLSRLSIRPQFIDGLRVTDAATMEIVEMVLAGKINKNLVSLINRAGGTAVGLCGKDGHLLTARPSANSATLGFVGDVARVDPAILHPLLASNHIPVIATVAADEAGQAYNINADTAAGELSAALGAEKLILLTDVAGILEDRENPASLVKEIDIKGVKKMVEEGKVAGGMIPKVNCCVRSLAQGVRTASIVDGRVPHSLLLEILTDEGAGTMITG
eukprot:TRINITY_DN5548_c0_g1_i3.p1 TRINITY_DN5548_c0_g1~~TRINITY_DN5548_c0_g1_i3.p1  ORF type:complete len:354 (-),score=49.73 TRINITY_DN5548_c0_g1_i3:461-1522(-)